MEIKDSVIIITGASQGIGLAAARLLAEKGAKVVLAARSKDLIENLEKEILGSFAVVTDMRKKEDIKNLVNKTIEKFGKIDILINNAGQAMYGSIETINLEDYRQIMELNVFSVVEAMQAVIPEMRKQGKGMIVNVSSMLAKMYIPGISAYSSTKYALNSISFTARQELAKDGIIVSVISPRITATNFGKNSRGQRPAFSNTGRAPQPIDPPERVAEKIEEVIRTEQQEITLSQ